jgi:hypothetical protein
MKKLLLILLCVPLIGLGQSVGCLDGGNCLSDHSCCLIDNYNVTTSTIDNISVQFKEPDGWELTKDSYSKDKTNIMKSYGNVELGAMIQLYIVESREYITKEDAAVLMENSDFINSFTNGLESGGAEVISTKAVLIDNYPALEVVSYAYNKTQKQVQWLIFYKNKMINFQGVSIINNFGELYPFFNQLRHTLNISSSR